MSQELITDDTVAQPKINSAGTTNPIHQSPFWHPFDEPMPSSMQAEHDASNIALRKARRGGISLFNYFGLGSLVLGRNRWFRMLRISSGKHAQLVLFHSHKDQWI